ncbi:hypothetical protein A2303_00045 [Candidatus Falkowbacteria bacterium RIFOXYB2_FULL_47_14]|uniref:Uncharacterized protein n=1 Tax=Candidatus Falkowbacteria bacterium RIFOXYA2_FULL_47_19 TaxID=1797994 RepID=A0A1F5SL29_9BACT|nr:MAG: hypothetical protein A2227_02185 [Candidatus Falkowbacteria bacterium RIFOXYA2_FULL_47_19]OGF36897.1 MAG: hypothetical protein A2468_08010 [Candidatus Falkowbacteria bacterium RIFOXYC2_FULL_46_15]OGF43385.1 MAG: hypothetical protein A2303_00045 [Candidatus Falkowbacteria bacterium RIFOXYB2_FULL_47_14]
MLCLQTKEMTLFNIDLAKDCARKIEELFSGHDQLLFQLQAFMAQLEEEKTLFLEKYNRSESDPLVFLSETGEKYLRWIASLLAEEMEKYNVHFAPSDAITALTLRPDEINNITTGLELFARRQMAINEWRRHWHIPKEMPQKQSHYYPHDQKLI